MVAQGLAQRRGHQRCVAGGGEQVFQAGGEFAGAGLPGGEAGADAAVDRQQLLLVQPGGEPAVACEDHAEQGLRVEAGARQQPQLGQGGGVHLLRLVDQQHGAQAGRFQVGEPALAQGFEAGPAVVGADADGEDIAQFAVEVGQVALRVADHADGQVVAAGQAVGEHAQGDAFAGAGFAVDQGEAALAHQGVL